MPTILLIIKLLFEYGPTIYKIAMEIWDFIKKIRDDRIHGAAKTKFRTILQGKFASTDMESQLRNLHKDLLLDPKLVLFKA